MQYCLFESNIFMLFTSFIDRYYYIKIVSINNNGKYLCMYQIASYNLQFTLFYYTILLMLQSSVLKMTYKFSLITLRKPNDLHNRMYLL